METVLVRESLDRIRAMPPGTLVLELAPGEQRELEERLSAGDFEYRQVDHARFSARGEGVVATLYRSGKLVDTAEFTASYWRDHLRNAVEFAEGINCLAEQDLAVLLEIGPAAALLGMGRHSS